MEARTRMKRRVRLAAYVGLMLLILTAPASAEEADHVPLTENFSAAEQAGIWGLAAVNIGLLVAKKPIVAHLGPPWIGAPGALDLAVSDALYAGPGSGKFLVGAPDLLGNYIGPGLVVLWYGANAASLGLRGRSLNGNPNADHELLGLIEAYDISLALTSSVKYVVGRERPMYALGRVPYNPDDTEANLSFFSGHASSSFCLAAFLSRDLGDRLVHQAMIGRSPAFQLWMGRVLPATLLYGVAGLIGFSRIVDQKHYLSDVVTGAAVGAVTGNLVYALHFDPKGNPRRRSVQRVQARLVPFGQGAAVTGTF